MSPSTEEFWRAYLGTLPSGSSIGREGYTEERFGDSPSMADELGALVASGTKTATCSALWEYEAEDEPLPEVGAAWVVLDGRGEPLCVAETTEVTVRAYQEVDERFAFDEGEGDRTLAYWRAAHEDFFSRTLPAIGKTFSPGMPLICERFRVVYGGRIEPGS